MTENNHNFRTSARIYDAVVTLLIIRVNLERVRCTSSINAAAFKIMQSSFKIIQDLAEASVFLNRAKSYRCPETTHQGFRVCMYEGAVHS